LVAGRGLPEGGPRWGWRRLVRGLIGLRRLNGLWRYRALMLGGLA